MVGLGRNKIQSRFLIQIALTILLLTAIGVSGALLLNNIQRIENELNTAGAMNDNFTRLQSDVQHYFELFIANPLNQAIFSARPGETIQTDFSDINRILLARTNHRILNSNQRLKEINDSLILLSDKLVSVYNEIELSLHERGNINEGYIAKLAKSRISIAKKTARFDTSGLLIMRLFETEKYYLNSLDEQYARTLKQITSQIARHLSNADPSIVDDISTSSSEYNESLVAIENINKRIGLNTHRGYWGDFNKLTHKISELNETYYSELENYSARIYLIHHLLFIIMILLLGGLYIFSLHRLMKAISYPVYSALDIVKHFNKGLVLEIPTPENVKYEFREFIEQIKILSNHLIERTKFIDSLLKQDFSKDIILLGTRDNFSKSLLALKKKLEKNQERQDKFNAENAIRQYINQGVANFSDILRKNNTEIALLCDEYISHLVKYIGAIQGGIFLIKEDNKKILELVSSFAYNRKKYLTKTIKVGEGLLGTCAAEKKSIYIDDIPTDYVYVTSGLGDAPPNFLLLLPLVHDNELVGVVELAALKKYKDEEQELGHLLAESLAGTILSVRQNEQTRVLLEKSQQQAAEMVEQEEEMRQNMEELKATQEESARREEEMQTRLNAYSNVFAIIEYRPDGTIVEINKKTTELTSLTEEEMVGKQHSAIFGAHSKFNKDFIANIHEVGYADLTETVTIRAQEFQIEMRFSTLEFNYGKDENILGVITKYSSKNN